MSLDAIYHAHVSDSETATETNSVVRGSINMSLYGPSVFELLSNLRNKHLLESCDILAQRFLVK